MPAPRDQGVPVNVTQSLSMQFSSATSAVAGTLVGYNGAGSNGGNAIFGILREDASQNRWVSVAVAGLAEVFSGGALNPGDSVGANGIGQAVAVAAGTHMIGRVVPGSSATAAGQRVQVLITREGTN
jgi:hypothetical protein